MPPDEIGLFCPRMNMYEFAANSVDSTKERGADWLSIDIRNNGGGSFAAGANAVMNRRVW